MQGIAAEDKKIKTYRLTVDRYQRMRLAEDILDDILGVGIGITPPGNNNPEFEAGWKSAMDSYRTTVKRLVEE